MCTVSMVIDYYRDRMYPRWPHDYTVDHTWPKLPPYSPPTTAPIIPSEPETESASSEQIEALREEIVELKKLLLQAKEFDDKTGQPECEDAEKVALVRKLAEFVGVDMEEVFAKSESA